MPRRTNTSNAIPGGVIPVIDPDEVLADLQRRASRDVARRAKAGAYAYPILFALGAWVTGLADDQPRTTTWIGLALLAISALRLLRCRMTGGCPVTSMSERNVMRTVLLTHSAVWTFYVCFTIYHYGMDWHGMLVLLCSASSMMAGLFAFAPDLKLARAFTVLMTVPPAIVGALDASPHAQVTSIFMLVFALVMSRMTQQQHQEYWRALETNELLRRHAEALAEARKEAEQASRAKSAFLANISHELRTPLHGILSYARFGMQRSGRVDTAKVVEYFTRIETSGSGLLALFEDLLDLSRLEAGRMTCNREPQHLGPVVHALADEFLGSYQELGVSLEITTPRDKIKASIDPVRIKQVLRNLLANASRFAPTATTVRMTVERTDGMARIVIEDEGVGIPDGEHELIFDKFAQSSQTDTGAGGTGLGLTISRQIVELHDGQLWAEDCPGGGARFVVELPVLVESVPAEEPAMV